MLRVGGVIREVRCWECSAVTNPSLPLPLPLIPPRSPYRWLETPDCVKKMCYSVLLNTPLRDTFDTANEVGSNAV